MRLDPGKDKPPQGAAAPSARLGRVGALVEIAPATGTAGAGEGWQSNVVPAGAGGAAEEERDEECGAELSIHGGLSSSGRRARDEISLLHEVLQHRDHVGRDLFPARLELLRQQPD